LDFAVQQFSISHGFPNGFLAAKEHCEVLGGVLRARQYATSVGVKTRRRKAALCASLGETLDLNDVDADVHSYSTRDAFGEVLGWSTSQPRRTAT